MSTERERFDWEREHSVLTPEGQIESARAFGRGLGRHRTGAGRIFLGGALVIAAMLIVKAISSL
jgi:hypothetical protein